MASLPFWLQIHRLQAHAAALASAVFFCNPRARRLTALPCPVHCISSVQLLEILETRQMAGQVEIREFRKCRDSILSTLLMLQQDCPVIKHRVLSHEDTALKQNVPMPFEPYPRSDMKEPPEPVSTPVRPTFHTNKDCHRLGERQSRCFTCKVEPVAEKQICVNALMHWQRVQRDTTAGPGPGFLL